MKSDITVMLVTLASAAVFAVTLFFIGTSTQEKEEEAVFAATEENNFVSTEDDSEAADDNAGQYDAVSDVKEDNDGTADAVLQDKETDYELPYTLSKMKETDYFEISITGLSNEKSDDVLLAEEYSIYGTMLGKGMPVEEYKAAMETEWIDCTEYGMEAETVVIDINEEIRYDDYVRYLKMLSRYDGVYLYQIGTSTDNRPLYAIEIDITSEYDKETFILTGQTHTREYAGGVFILKQLSELIAEAQTDSDIMEMLKHYRYAAVPIISLDVREYIIDNPLEWSKANQLYKAYADGTDGNRNYPGLQWGQIAKGNKLRALIEDAPGYANYPGDYAGSANETKAMMKFFYHYVVVEQALIHLDYHQQGSIIYAGKPWQTEEQQERCMELAQNLCTILNSNNRRKYEYRAEEADYGLRGEGSTASDYTAAIAAGAKFSPAFGYCVMTDNIKEYPLIEFVKLDYEMYGFNEINPDFATATFEIGYGKNYIGYTKEVRAYLAREYEDYNFSEVLKALPELSEENQK